MPLVQQGVHEVRRLIVLSAVAGVAVLGTQTSGASAEPTTETQGCQVVASKYLSEDAAGHHGVQNAASRTGGEGPCGFGNPPGHD